MDKNPDDGTPRIRINLSRKLTRKIIEQGGNLDDAAEITGRTPRELHDEFEEPKEDKPSPD